MAKRFSHTFLPSPHSQIHHDKGCTILWVSVVWNYSSTNQHNAQQSAANTRSSFPPSFHRRRRERGNYDWRGGRIQARPWSEPTYYVAAYDVIQVQRSGPDHYPECSRIFFRLPGGPWSSGVAQPVENRRWKTTTSRSVAGVLVFMRKPRTNSDRNYLRNPGKPKKKCSDFEARSEIGCSTS